MDDQKLEVEMAHKLIFTYSTTSMFQLNNRNINARNLFFFLQQFYFVYLKVFDIFWMYKNADNKEKEKAACTSIMKYKYSVFLIQTGWIYIIIMNVI